MTSSLDAALSGLVENQRNLELIANNLANVNTVGYKRAEVHFQDLLDTTAIVDALNGTLPEDETLATSSGVITNSVSRIFTQGPLLSSDRPLDFAIVGDGFFRVLQEDGTRAYTRDGTFQLDGLGRIVTSDGQPIEPAITMPAGFSDLRISIDGEMTVLRAYTQTELDALGPDESRSGIRETVGQIQLTRFVNPAGLVSIGANLFVETEESLAPIDALPGETGMGIVRNGWVEGSNVQLAREMTQLVIASRAYQINLVAYQTIDEMLKEANQLAA